MVMVLELEMVQEIQRIGWLRHPMEACGLLLPEPFRSRQVWEMPNRSPSPNDSFVMTGTDMAIALEGYFPDDIDPKFLADIVAWHTHPAGGLGPSADDLRTKPAYYKSLVVTLYPDQPAKATWF